MDRSLLGHRLRKARLAKKMTQSEVVGDFITRNMLSQIESGVAAPSMRTLEYLSEVLDVPLASLMSELPDEPSERLEKAKQAMRGNAPESVIELIGTPEKGAPLYDEFAALLAKAYAMTGDAENSEKWKNESVYY